MRPRFLMMAALLTGLCACDKTAPDSEAVQSCERYLIGKLKAPSTYKRIKTFEYDKAKTWHVSIEYDAVNTYNAPIRETQYCVFPSKNGVPDTSQYIDHDAELLNTSADVGAIDLPG